MSLNGAPVCAYTTRALERQGLSFAIAALALAAAVCVLAPSRVSDADALSRLSVGRLISAPGPLPRHDPFTFAQPNAPFADPEWLGDLGLHALYRSTSEVTLQRVIVGIGCIGCCLALWLGVQLGATPLAMLLLLLGTLAAAAPRIGARNDVHLFWIVPLFALLTLEVRRAPRWYFALAGLSWLWANIHSSFVLGIAYVLVALMQAPPRWRFAPLLLLVLYPWLPWLGLAGKSPYAQLLDHLSGADVYRSLLSEWQSPLSSSGIAAVAPLYVLTVVGLFVLIRQRAQWSLVPVVSFGVGCVLAYSSRRFLPMLTTLIAPAMGGALCQWLSGLSRTARRSIAAVGGVVVIGYFGVSAWSRLRNPSESVFGRVGGPEPAIRFITTHTPAGTRIANAFNDGPWLLWFAPEHPHYLDPRNNLGASVLAKYVREILPNRAAFDAEARRLDIDLALLAFDDHTTYRLFTRLAESSAWQLVYWDGWHALYARSTANTRGLIERFKYRILQPTLDLTYLDAPGVDRAGLERDLSQLETQSRAHAAAIRAYLSLNDPQHSQRSAQMLESLWPELADTQGLTRALAKKFP